MYYKHDWESAKNRLLAFWANKSTDRALVGVLAPRKGSAYTSYAELRAGLDANLNAIPEGDHEAIHQWWVDPEQNYHRMIEWFENTYFGGEAVPCTFVNWGAMAMAAFYGSQPDFRKETVWYLPSIDNLETWSFQFNPDTNVYWQQTMAIMRLLVERNQGEYFIGTPEFGTAGDLLSLMRGMERFALDLLESPEASKKAINMLSETWVRLHEEVYQLTRSKNDGGGILAWMLLWAPGRISQLACDFASIISPGMFRTFFVPEIEQEGNWCEHGVYHLDGPQAMRSTLDTLLHLPQIQTIQWTPGENLAPTYSPQYVPGYKKIQAAGKRLYLLVEPEEIEPLLQELSPRGLFLRTHADSEEQANDLLRSIEKWSRRETAR